MPVNALIIRALMHYFAYYGDNFKIECPTGSGNLMNLFEVAREIAIRNPSMLRSVTYCSHIGRQSETASNFSTVSCLQHVRNSILRLARANQRQKCFAFKIEQVLLRHARRMIQIAAR